MKVIPVLAGSALEFTGFIHEIINKNIGSVINLTRTGEGVVTINTTMYVYAHDIRAIQGARFTEYKVLDGYVDKKDNGRLLSYIDQMAHAEKARLK